MAEPLVLSATDENGIHRLTMNRPDVRNAFNPDLVHALAAGLDRAAQDPSCRAVVLTGAGKVFSAGADLENMRRAGTLSEGENTADAMNVSRLLDRLDSMPVPAIALVQGAAIAGGLGLVAACDVVIAAADAVFAISEVRLGLIPAMISPYVIGAIGARQARRYMLTGERFGGSEALEMGLVHCLAPSAGELDAALEPIIDAILKSAPGAIAETKALLRTIAGASQGAGDRQRLASALARRRASAEGREGVDAFLEKRAPDWLKPG